MKKIFNFVATAPVAYLGGILLCLIVHSWYVAAAAGCAAALMLVMALITRRGGVLLLAGFVGLGLLIGSSRLEMLSASPLKDQFLGKRVAIEAAVTAASKVKGESEKFTAHVDTVNYDKASITDDEDILVEIACRSSCQGDGSFQPGEHVTITGLVKEARASSGADFDYGLYLRRQGINAVIEAGPAGIKRVHGKQGEWSRITGAVRNYALSSLGTGGWGSAGSVLKGMVLGDTDSVPDQIISDFQGAGILHMLAVSGENVVLLGFVVSIICRALYVPRLISSIVSIIVICFYVPVTGSGPSIVRAGVVGVLGLMALLFSRQSNRYHFLALAAAVILTLNPYSLFDPGFQLSFAAVLAIFMIAPLVHVPLRRLPELLREVISVSVAAGLATAPITLVHFQQVSLVTVPANIAAEPMAGPVMALGVLSILANLVSPDLCWLLNAMMAACTGYIISAAHFFASLPGAVYTGRAPSIAAVFGYYAALAGAVLAAGQGGASRVRAWAVSITGGRRRHLALAVVALILLAAAGFACFGRSGAAHAPAGFTISFLDVGQGDAELFQAPGGATVLIDGGPGSGVLDRLSESGVSRLDAVILTHAHADHLTGLIEVLKHYPVAAVFDGGPQTNSPLYRDFLTQIDEKHIPYRVLRRGQTLNFGELAMQVYNPGERQNPDDPNANSVVLVASYRGVDILCPGDAESDVLGTLGLPPVDIYKVGHHGSKDGSLAGLLARLQPQVAVISVGAQNDYGHPAASTVSKLKQAGTRIFRTDHQGTIRVTISDKGIEVKSEK
ncbi:MAG: DNA internalization-related competence protein ComEC/Rec2 [Actinobacteria bacterium]|nr:DNA internalization-related competence protein ComEC/Rec2 [Actinomycetota bacterium]